MHLLALISLFIYVYYSRTPTSTIHSVSYWRIHILQFTRNFVELVSILIGFQNNFIRFFGRNRAVLHTGLSTIVQAYKESIKPFNNPFSALRTYNHKASCVLCATWCFLTSWVTWQFKRPTVEAQIITSPLNSTYVALAHVI